MAQHLQHFGRNTISGRLFVHFFLLYPTIRFTITTQPTGKGRHIRKGLPRPGPTDMLMTCQNSA